MKEGWQEIWKNEGGNNKEVSDEGRKGKDRTGGCRGGRSSQVRSKLSLTGSKQGPVLSVDSALIMMHLTIN